MPDEHTDDDFALEPVKTMGTRRWRKTMKKTIRLISISLLACCFSACSTAYNRAWKTFEDPSPDDAFTGKWRGHWTSGHNGHTGGLRAMITHEEGSAYKARFHATYAKFLQFAYTNILTAEPRGKGVITFKGENDLGKLAGGVFKYEGQVNGPHFKSSYTAKKDHGVFIMERITP
jgi:hypothetical protein